MFLKSNYLCRSDVCQTFIYLVKSQMLIAFSLLAIITNWYFPGFTLHCSLATRYQWLLRISVIFCTCCPFVLLYCTILMTFALSWNFYDFQLGLSMMHVYNTGLFVMSFGVTLGNHSILKLYSRWNSNQKTKWSML